MPDNEYAIKPRNRRIAR